MCIRDRFRPDRFDVTRTTETVRTDQTRTGVETQVSLRVDRESRGLRVISRTAIPMVRSRTLTFTGTRFKPKTRLYAFFDKQAVSTHCTPSSASYAVTGASLVAGDALVSDGTGKIVGTFLIPDPKVSGNPRFATGDIEFRLTSSEYNGVVSTEQRPGTAGSTIYSSSGLLETQQETIIATRNAQVRRNRLGQTTSFNTTTSNDQRVRAGNFNDEQALLQHALAEAAAARLEAAAAIAQTAIAIAEAAEARRIADELSLIHI